MSLRGRRLPAPHVAPLGITRDDLAIFGMADPAARRERVRSRLEPLLSSLRPVLHPVLDALCGRALAASHEADADDRAAPPPARAALRFAAGPDEASPCLLFAVNRAGVHARLRWRPADLRRYDEDDRGLPAPGEAGDAGFWRDAAEALARPRGRLDVGPGWPEARAVLLSAGDLAPAYRPLVALWRQLES